MAASDAPTARTVPPPRLWVPWAVMGLACLVVLAWCGLRPSFATPDAVDDTTADGEAVADGEGDGAPLSVAHVSGRVWLEVQPEPEEVAPAERPEFQPAVPTVIVEHGEVRVVSGPDTGGDDGDGLGTGTGTDAGTGTSTGTGSGTDTDAADPGERDAVDDAAEADVDATTGDASADEEAPTYALESPESGTCTVQAWQAGTPVATPTPCDAEGRFEVALHPGVSGPTAFEILVPGRLRAVVEVDVPAGGRGRLPEVALGVAETLVGQVVDRDGEPIAGVAIEAMPLDNLGEPEPWRVRSADDGAFTIDTLPPGPVGLRARAEGYAVSVAEAIVPQDDVLLVLDRLRTLQGRVAGPPDVLARTKVRLEGSGVWPARTVEVDAEGRFAFDEVPDGIYAVEAIAAATGELPGYASIPLENVTPDLSITLGLVAAFDVDVLVEDPQGHPVVDARVTLGNASIGVLQRFATTDATGAATIGPVVPGPYVLRADAEGYLPSSPLSLTIEDADPPVSVLRLAAPGSIRGEVVDEDGRPVEGARISVVAEQLHTVGESRARAQVFAAATEPVAGTGSLGVTTGPVPPIPRADEDDEGVGEDGPAISDPRSDAAGRFAVELLPPGRYSLVATHVDYAHGSEVAVEVKAGDDVIGVRLVLRAGERLTGRVVDGNGRPVDGARVSVDDDIVFTDRLGVFDAGPRRGRVRLVARAFGYAPAVRTVTVGGRPVDVEIVLGDADGELTGRVEGENGEVLEDARVTLRMLDDLSATEVRFTNAKGIYTFTGLARGRGEIVVDHPDHGEVRRSVEVSRDRTPVDVALPRGWSLVVEVLAEGTRTPLPGVRITAGDHHASTDDEGRATLAHLVDASVTVTADAEGWGEATARVTRPDTAASTELRLVVREGGGMSGRVTDYRGDAVADAVVSIYDADDERVARTATGADGRWSVGSLPAGDYEVEADPPPGRDDELAPAALSSDVLRGHVTRGVDLRFDRR